MPSDLCIWGNSLQNPLLAAWLLWRHTDPAGRWRVFYAHTLVGLRASILFEMAPETKRFPVPGRAGQKGL